MLKLPQVADSTAEGYDHRQPQGKAELKPGGGEPLAQAPAHRPPGHPAKQGGVLCMKGLPAQQQKGVEHAAVKDAQTSLGQIGVVQQCLETAGQPLPAGGLPAF